MLDTTLSKTARAAELLAASIIIHELVKDARHAGSYDLHLERRELLATIVTSTFTPAEA